MQNYELMLLMNPNISDEVDEILDNIKKPFLTIKVS